MRRVRLKTFTCYYQDGSDQKVQHPSLAEAMAAAEKFCGNNRYNKPFPNEETYLYGPGNGVTSIMIRQDCEYVKD